MNKTKRAIYNSAIEVFSKYGYNKSTMDQIAESAKVAKGTLYYHFKNKEQIFNYIIEEGMKHLKYEIEEVAKSEDNVYLQIRDILKLQLTLLYDKRALFKVIISQMWGGENRQIALRKSVEEYLDIMKQYLQVAMDKGVIRKCDSSLLAYTLFGTLCSTVMYELINEEKIHMDDVVDDLMKFILKGIEVRY